MFPPALGHLGKTRFCVNESEAGISTGDQGGPLYVVKNDGKTYQIGIAIFVDGKSCIHSSPVLSHAQRFPCFEVS